MKKIGIYFLVVLLSIVVFVFNFDSEAKSNPNTYYNIYLDDEFIGMIEDKDDLEKYINSQADTIRKNVKEYMSKVSAIDTFSGMQLPEELKDKSKEDSVKYILDNKKNFSLNDIDIDNLEYYLDKKLYDTRLEEIKEMREYIDSNKIYLSVEDVYTPNGIKMERVYTYNKDLKTVPEIYKEIVSKKSCSIAGYKFTIKRESEGVEDLIIYTTDTNIFSEAIESLITIFVNDEIYEAYKKGIQNGITSTGSIIENIYVQEDITYKAVNVSVEEKIYTDAKDLSAYLLYGDSFEEKTVKVKNGDSIESLAFDNKISVQEFLIFNTQYTNRNNMLVAGTDVTISKVDPKIQIVVETYEKVKKETDFSTVEQYDETLAQGMVQTAQEGKKGHELVTQNVKSVNGEITYVNPIDKEVIDSPVPKIIKIGTKFIPNVGSISSWGWPTKSGYTISSYYGYRLSVFGEGNFHSGLDIAGTGYGSPVYASNNGVIEEMKVYRDKRGNYTSYGISVLINHNNGYYSLYGHMSGYASGLREGATVSRGQVIGYVGSTGWATGPHLHYEIRTCSGYSCITNPLKFYR